MAKVIKKKIKLVIAGWAATPAPPVWSALWQAWVAINDFCTQFNEATKEMKWKMLPTKINVYDDKTFDFVFTQPPATILIKDKIALKKWSARSHMDKVWTITETQLKEIYEVKAADLNANDVDAWVKILAGSARAMWVKVEWGV